jgi:hypothetical protein
MQLTVKMCKCNLAFMLNKMGGYFCRKYLNYSDLFIYFDW